MYDPVQKSISILFFTEASEPFESKLDWNAPCKIVMQLQEWWNICVK